MKSEEYWEFPIAIQMESISLLLLLTNDVYKLYDFGWLLKIAFTVVSSIAVHLSALIVLTQFHSWKI